MVLFVSLLVLMFLHQNAADTVLDGTELVFAFMIHRHGDRTPVTSSLPMIAAAIDNDEAEALIAPWGYGQLTSGGMQRAYRTGQFIRRRYDELLSETFNRSEIYIRSTDSTRAKMTVLTAMAAVYPAIGDTWSEEINWVPIPYTTVAAKYDFNLFAINCPIYDNAMMSLMYTTSSSFDQYSDLFSSLTNILGYDLSAMPVMTYNVFDVFVSLRNLGYDLGSEILDLLPGLEEASAVAADILYADNNYVSLQAGPLLNEFFEEAAAVIAGNDTQRVRVYSAHDINVYSFEAITQIANKQGPPKYASLYSLELRRVTETGKYVVLPVYLNTPEDPEVYLQVAGCDGVLCDYETFYDIVAPFLLTTDEWRTNCGFTEDLVVDASSLD